MLVSSGYGLFAITGITPDEWDNLIGPEPDDELDC